MEYQKKTRYFLVSCFVVILILIFFEQNIIQKICFNDPPKKEHPPVCPTCTTFPTCPACPPPKVCPNVTPCPNDVGSGTVEDILFKGYNVATEDDLYAICPEVDKKSFVRNDSLIHIDTDYDHLVKYSYMQGNSSVTTKEYQDYCAPFFYTRLRFGQLDVDIPVCVWPGDVDVIVSRSVINGDFWDYNVATFMLTQVMGREKPGVVVDGGVNIGEFTILSAYLGQTVIGFEPLPDHVDMVKRSLFLNNLHKNVYLVKNALSYSSSTMTLTVDNLNKGSSFVGNNKGTNTVDIDVVTYDMVIEKLKPLLGEYFSVRYLKVDIEGFEPFFAIGAKDFWFNHYVEGLAFELTDKRFKDLKCNAALFNVFFQKLGYNVIYTKGEQERLYYFNEKKTDHFYKLLQDRTLLDVFMIKKSPLL